jgi:hypothetical protein
VLCLFMHVQVLLYHYNFVLFFFQTRLLEENNKELREHINLLDTRVNQLEGDKLVINNKLEACMK